MNINKATAQEIDSVMSLIRDAIQKMHNEGIHQWGEYYPTREIFLADIAASSLYTARIENSIAGIIVLDEEQASQYQSLTWVDKTGKVLVIHRLCVSPAFQGQGIAKKFMQFAEDYAHKNKYNSIRLDAFTKNKISVGLYDSLGYQSRGSVSFMAGTMSYCYEKVL